jgi:dihydroxyacetone synthase
LWHHITNHTQLLSPIASEEVPIIRGIGLNYYDHAKEANLPIPDEPMLFIKPRTALIGPSPSSIKIPPFVQDGTSDYEAELAVVLSESGRDIPEASALDYVLGYVCSNDVSARRQQFKDSQVSFSKGKNGELSLVSRHYPMEMTNCKPTIEQG